MNTFKSIFTHPNTTLTSNSQQWRSIRVKILNNNLERGLTYMQRIMQSSGIERMIKNEQIYHVKNSEKRVLARKNMERRLKSQDLARKLKSILVRKVSCDTVQDAKKGSGGSAVFVARNRFAVLDKTTNQVLVKNLKNEIVKKSGLPITTDSIFYAGTGNLLCRAEDRVVIFDLQQRTVLGSLQTVKNVHL
ncbi:ribosomal protein S21 family protein [Artemisia annua]|uniref:Ribosomal protein S21 family protein n=1 Tax=Artemisia annua TaxID=35608 RepID=A0A2U1NV34_ARTAN|nr:ribosomal protein S21 family protein [Artemisia annua]